MKPSIQPLVDGHIVAMAAIRPAQSGVRIHRAQVALQLYSCRSSTAVGALQLYREKPPAVLEHSHAARPTVAAAAAAAQAASPGVFEVSKVRPRELLLAVMARSRFLPTVRRAHLRTAPANCVHGCVHGCNHVFGERGTLPFAGFTGTPLRACLL